MELACSENQRVMGGDAGISKHARFGIRGRSRRGVRRVGKKKIITGARVLVQSPTARNCDLDKPKRPGEKGRYKKSPGIDHLMSKG